MINEGIHPNLKEIYDEFDRHARIFNTDYSIDADYHNVQGYRLLDCNDVSGFLRHIANFIKDKPINLDYDGSTINYDRLKENDFSVNTYNPLFMFTLKSIQERKMNEEQYKYASKSHTLKQAPFPQSVGEHDTAFSLKTPAGGPRTKKKPKKKRTLTNSKNFDDRLIIAINENLTGAVVPTEPEILFTRDQANLNNPEDMENALEDAIQAESIALTRYLAILEATENDANTIIFENMIEKCTKHINQLRNLIMR
jgi:hypothetical protein